MEQQVLVGTKGWFPLGEMLATGYSHSTRVPPRHVCYLQKKRSASYHHEQMIKYNYQRWNNLISFATWCNAIWSTHINEEVFLTIMLYLNSNQAKTYTARSKYIHREGEKGRERERANLLKY